MKSYKMIIGILAVFIMSLVILSILFVRTLQGEMAEQFNKQQLLLANAEALNLHKYLGGMKDEMLHIAQSVSLLQIRKDADLKFITEGVVKDSSVIRKQVKFLNRRGEILFSRGNAQAEGPDEKTVIERVKRLCPGGVLIQQDTKMLTMVAPVCRLDSLTGAVMITMGIQDIAKEFLSTLKFGSRENAWLMDDKGTLLYHPAQPGMIGRNLHKTDASCFQCHRSFEVEKKAIEGGDDYCGGDYYGRYVSPTGEDKILAYSSAMAGDTRWIVAVSAPYSEVTRSIKRSMEFYTWIIILIAMTISGVSAWLIVLNQKRQQAEERAKHEKELEMMHSEKLASLERLTSGIASEIGNPLTSVSSFVEILLGMEEDEFKRETLETTFFHVNRISDILKQLSGFSKMMTSELKPCNTNSVIEDSLSLLQYDKRVQEVTVVRDLQPLPAITTDRGQLSQVMVNIILNAVDAMPNGGTLTIRSRTKDDSVVIEFEDTGVGIAEEELGRVFDPFYTTQDKRTGLGLAVSYSIIQKLKGSLTVESELSKGSRFVITLPLDEAR